MMRAGRRLAALSYHADVPLRAGELRVRAVFDRAWHLETASGEVVSITAASHDGPLAVRVDAGVFGEVAVRPGDRGRIVGGSGGEVAHLGAGARGGHGGSRSLRGAFVVVGSCVIQLPVGRSWRPEMCGLAAVQWNSLVADLAFAMEGMVAPNRGGVAPAVAGGLEGAREPAWLRQAAEEVRGLERALETLDGLGIVAGVQGLVGLGPGLTPAGDDLLCGLLVGLHVLEGRTGEHRLRCAGRTVLAVAVDGALHRTTALSRTLLRYAARGVSTEPLLRFVRSIGTDEGVRTHGEKAPEVVGAVVCHRPTPQRRALSRGRDTFNRRHPGRADEDVHPYECGGREMEGAIADLLRIGHSSGSDMLAGAVLAARIVTAWEEAGAPAVVHSA